MLMTSDLESAAHLVGGIVGPGRGFGLHRDRKGTLTLVIETMTSSERDQIEAAVGEQVNVLDGRSPRRVPNHLD